MTLASSTESRGPEIGRWRPGAAWLRALLVSVVTGAALFGCGGQPAGLSALPSALSVLVTDTFGTPVVGAQIKGAANGQTMLAVTNDSGSALLLADRSVGNLSLTVSRESFYDKTIDVGLTIGGVTDREVVLERVTSPAGGALVTRSGLLPVIGSRGRQLRFEVELVIVGGDAQPIAELLPGAFALQDCAPNITTDGVDCIRRSGGDLSYRALAGPSLVWIPGMSAQPYAAALLMDQSGSTEQADPTRARLYAAKAFLRALADGDRALLAAFASGPDARIAQPPLTVYPPFVERVAADTLFPTIDALAHQVGGNTPLYAAVDSLRAQVVGDTSLPPTLARSVVVFSDGADTDCGSRTSCRALRVQTIESALAAPLRIFAIGLSSRVDVEALGELAVSTGGAMLYAETADQLLPLYRSVGRLLSLELPTYRLAWTVEADRDGAFASGDTVLGRVAVTTAGGRVVVPFIVSVP